MSHSHLTNSSLRPLVNPIGKKKFLLEELAKIDSQVSSILSCKPLPSSRLVASPSKKRADGLSGKILAALKAAEDEGVKVVDLAKKLKVKGTSLHAWFATKGKKNPAIKKAGKGHYKLAVK